MKLNPLNGLPKWLEDGRDISHTSEKNKKNYLRSLKYYRQIYEATPKWYSEFHHKEILRIYKECRRKRMHIKFRRKESVRCDRTVPHSGSAQTSSTNAGSCFDLSSEWDHRTKKTTYTPLSHLIAFPSFLSVWIDKDASSQKNALFEFLRHRKQML